MRSKLNYLMTVSLKRKIKSKWFVIANICLALLIISLINIDSIITKFGGDFDKTTKLYIIDNTNEAYEIFNEQLVSSSKVLEGVTSNNYEVSKYNKTLEEAKKELEKEKNHDNFYLEFSYDEENILKAKLLTKEYIDIYDTQVLNNAINNTKVSLAIYHSNISLEELNKIYETVEIERIYLDKDKNNQDENMEMIMSSVFPIIILPLFMLIIFLVQMIGAEINDEKTSRGMEIIISNVSPATHFASKVIAGNVFVFLQGSLLIIYAMLGMYIRNLIGGSKILNGIGSEVGNMISNILASDIGNKLIYVIPVLIVLIIVTFIAYSLLAGILASMSTNIEDFQQVQTPIMIILLISYYLAIMAGLFEGSLFIKIVGMIPLISAILAPSLFILGQITLIELIISTILVVIVDYILVKYGLKIYKVGILNYSSSKLWKKMFKALKE